MSFKTLPLLHVNMSAEMLYILAQRLRAQNVAHEKSFKVLKDLVSAAFGDKLIKELFRPQELYSRRAMRQLFDRLAHMSIMRLNESSMDKLYDLMTMAVKYQLQSLTSPNDIILVTLNHVDGIRKLIADSAPHVALLDRMLRMTMETYMNMNTIELQLVKETLLTFYQDSRVKVSILLREMKQLNDGRFIVATEGAMVPYKTNAPGKIQMYEAKAATILKTFDVGGSYEANKVPPNFEKVVPIKTKRGTDLGLNMYTDQASTDVQGGVGSASIIKSTTSNEGGKEKHIQNELTLLNRLLGGSLGDSKKGGQGRQVENDGFMINLFNSESEERSLMKKLQEDEQSDRAAKVIQLEGARGKSHKKIDKLVNEIKISSVNESKSRKSRGDDLLELMDNADE